MNRFLKIISRSTLYLSVLTLIILFSTSPLANRPTFTPGPEVKSLQTSLPQAPQSHDLPAPQLSAQNILVLDLNSNTVLLDKNSHQRAYPASLTKVMTALVAINYYAPDQILTVNTADLSIGNTMNLKPHDQLTFENLLKGLLIPSGNDAALALAENYPSGYTGFIQAMNQKAQALHLEDTNFTNVSGLEDPQHYTTAFDLATITTKALNYPLIREIVATSQTSVTSEKDNVYQLTSTNELLNADLDIIGVKTGWTPQAGECLITLTNRDSHPVLIVILNSTDRFGDTKNLLGWFYQNFSW